MAELWSDYSGAIISDIDSNIKKKYGIALSELLANPKDFAGEESIAVKIGNIKDDIDAYIEEQKQQALSREKNFNDMLERADSISQKLAQRLSVIAKQNGVPLIKPVSIDRNTDNEEHIYIDSSDDSVLGLVEKLAASSMIIADFTDEYNNYKLGEWYFSGQKNYVLSVYMPISNVMLLDNSKVELDALLNAAAEFISG